jgi:hypothetical protein
MHASRTRVQPSQLWALAAPHCLWDGTKASLDVRGTPGLGSSGYGTDVEFLRNRSTARVAAR